MEQEQLLAEAQTIVKEQAYYLHEAFERRRLKDALKHSSNLIGELKTELLDTTTYFTLFMQIFDELRLLEKYFSDEQKRGRKMKQLYQSVQQAGSIIPRIYLLITAGSVYIKTKQVKSIDILVDLT